MLFFLFLVKFVAPLNVSATMMVMMALHVLHRDAAPHANHKCFNLTLVVPTSDAEVAVLSPVLPPGVGSNLNKNRKVKFTTRKQISI